MALRIVSDPNQGSDSFVSCFVGVLFRWGPVSLGSCSVGVLFRWGPVSLGSCNCGDMLFCKTQGDSIKCSVQMIASNPVSRNNRGYIGLCRLSLAQLSWHVFLPFLKNRDLTLFTAATKYVLSCFILVCKRRDKGRMKFTFRPLIFKSSSLYFSISLIIGKNNSAWSYQTLC
jgi:hypothetical protein